MRGSLAAWGLAAALSLFAVAAAGCAGAGRVELVSLNYRSIDPPRPRAEGLDIDRCYWWTDESGRVWVALESVRQPLFGSVGEFTFKMSLALEALPAGAGRNYTVGKRELRAVARFVLSEARYVSSAGIVALYRESGDRLRGSMRLRVRREVSRLLGGWGRPSSYVLQGTFLAVHDEQRGRLITAATESRGWEREREPVQNPER